MYMGRYLFIKVIVLKYNKKIILWWITEPKFHNKHYMPFQLKYLLEPHTNFFLATPV